MPAVSAARYIAATAGRIDEAGARGVGVVAGLGACAQSGATLVSGNVAQDALELCEEDYVRPQALCLDDYCSP